MILTDSRQLCYSPLPPRDYAKWDAGVPQGDAAPFVDRVYGCPILKKYGISLEDISQGLHIWNLAWLLRPAFDELPARRGRSPDSYMGPGPNECTEIILFADQFEGLLYGLPTVFVSRVRAMKWSLPDNASLDATMRRARLAESSGNPLLGNTAPAKTGNIIQFGPRR